MATMQALKVVAEGLVTSFRYPHFMVQKHLSLEMPPPATIYGHICSAVGDWLEPRGLRFAYHFTYEAKVFDYEYIHTLEGRKDKVVPLDRELLFHPRLVLYLNQLALLPAFRSPYYTVVLGRSQDLFTYTSVEEVTLEQSEQVYYEATLLPYRMATRVQRGVTVYWPRYIDYRNHRNATFDHYLMLPGRAVDDPTERGLATDGMIRYDGEQPSLHWVDPSIRNERGIARGVAWHSFVESDNDTTTLS